MSVEWRSVVGYEGFYEVSNLGGVRSLSRKIGHNYKGFTRTHGAREIRASKNAHGYPCVHLCRDGKSKTARVHRLVAIAFIGPPPTSGHEVAHRDGTRTNANVDNLRWATRAENMADTLIHGTHNRGENNYASKLTQSSVAEARLLASSGVGSNEIARRLGVSRQAVRDAVTGRTWRNP